MEHTSRFLIYALVDPRSGEWRYVGKSCSGLVRPREHTRPCFLATRTYKNNWVRSLLARGLKPEILVLEEFSSAAELNDAEREWIAAARRAWVRLTNETDGGEGLAGRKHRRETKLKISLTRHGLSEAQRAEAMRLYLEEGLSTRAIAERFSTGGKVVWRILKTEGVRLRSKAETNHLRARAV